ncbi:hypothetical protein BDQ17DRAFT_1330721 [Cyathus striatus]|nr:hypothetical protein BDQ17DRAFT_1330721 [Cyathus striatus]
MFYSLNFLSIHWHQARCYLYTTQTQKIFERTQPIRPAGYASGHRLELFGDLWTYKLALLSLRYPRVPGAFRSSGLGQHGFDLENPGLSYLNNTTPAGLPEPPSQYSNLSFDHFSPMGLIDPYFPHNTPRVSGAFHSSRHPKESTSKDVPQKVPLLDSWFQQHSDHPYPSAEERNHLGTVTGLSPAQIYKYVNKARTQLSKSTLLNDIANPDGPKKFSPTAPVLANGDTETWKIEIQHFEEAYSVVLVVPREERNGWKDVDLGRGKGWPARENEKETSEAKKSKSKSLLPAQRLYASLARGMETDFWRPLKELQVKVELPKKGLKVYVWVIWT